jgi:hypothetical protein
MKLSQLQKKVLAFTLLISCINLFLGCHRFYKPVVINAPTAESRHATIKKLSTEGKYFILRQGYNSYALDDLVLDETKMTLTATIDKLSPRHQLYADNDDHARYLFKKRKGQDVVLKEVHLYTSDTTDIKYSTSYTIALADLQKIEVIEFNKQKTTSSYVWGTIGTVIGVSLAVLLISAALTPSTPDPPPTPVASSCPYISSFDGGAYQLQGEIYSAAVYPSMQRDDYLPLQMQPFNGDYRIKISNELKEIQHTDFADIIVAEHSKDVKMLIDPTGKLHSIASLQPPVSAMLNGKIDVRQQIAYQDNTSCIFKDDNGARPSEDLFVTFKNDLKNTRGKLILSARTSNWLNYLYGEFSKGFGSYYNQWDKEQEKKPASELEQWVNEQHIPLTIAVKTASGWKEIQQVRSIGPLLNRDIVIPFEMPANELAEFKISGGYLFWELDYAAIDYSADADFTIHTIKPYEAINEKGKNVLAEIINADHQYLQQPDIGDSTILKYKSISAKEGMVQTTFLHSSGYYKRIRNYVGKPEVAFLKSFTQPGAMAAFSRQKYLEAWNNIATAKQ